MSIAAPRTPEHQATPMVPTRVRRAAPLSAVARYVREPTEDGWRVHAWVSADPDDLHLRGHFPGMPIYPGVFIIETLCQAMTAAFGDQLHLRRLDSIRFLAPVLGGDELALTMQVATPVDHTWQVRAVGRRRDGVVTTRARATFDRAVTA